MRFSIILLFFLILSSFSVYAEECDWGVDVISSNIIKYEEDFEFKIRVFNFEGDKTNITIIRLIEDIFGNIIKEYENITCEATRDKNCVENFPNLEPGTYLIKGEIFPNCTDNKIENN